MSEHEAELLGIAERQALIAASFAKQEIAGPLTALEEAVAVPAKAFSGSWLGYHARVYYAGMRPPPAGARFSAEWGLMNSYAQDTVGEWEEWDSDQVKEQIHRAAGNPNLEPIKKAAAEARRKFEADKAAALSILTVVNADARLEKLKGEIEKLSLLSETEIIHALTPSGSKMSRDAVAITAGFVVPPHMEVVTTILWLRQPEQLCKQLSDAARAAGEHLARKSPKSRQTQAPGTHVFIGHGRSLLWRELKDFLEDKLNLPVDEFNRVPVAGVTNIARLSQMLDSAAIAFIIMTAEDETAAGTLRARMNVVHEAGLFQGKLGFTRAIVLLEEGCEEFSNIAGLGQIHFPKGNIKAAFQEVREVLEREEVIE